MRIVALLVLLASAAPAAAQAPQALEAASRRQQGLDTKLGPGEKLDPNTAPAEQIARLPGASRTVAERVVAERAIRPYRSAADLERVSGVGPATIEKWRTFLTLPATIPLWQVAVGVSFGLIFAKEVFGGVGRNFMNPALASRAFIYFAYPAQMTGDMVWTAVDGVSGATALAQFAAAQPGQIMESINVTC